MIRKLASVQLVTNLTEMEGYDNVVMARVLGWNVIVRKGECSVGDKVVYFEIDSLLPEDNPAFDFLKNSKGKIKALKPKKLRGYVSQGLVLPISILPEGEYEEGQDVTEILNVKKYEPEIKFTIGTGNRPINTKPYPNYIPKTDEERVQTIPEFLKKCAGHEFVVTEKLDGTSFTAFIRDGEFGLCSRNLQMPYDGTNLYGMVAINYDLENKFKEIRDRIGYDFALQGELIGAGIQKNKYRLQEHEIRWFNLFNIDRQKDIGFYFGDTDEFRDFKGITLGHMCSWLDMQSVPIIDSSFTMIDDVDALVEMASGKSKLYPEQEREGLVFRAKHNSELSKFGSRVSFKAISLDFLLQ